MILDLSYLNEVSGGYSGFISELLDKYIQDVPSDFDGLVEATHSKDCEKIRRASRRLISSTKIVGATVIGEN